MRRFALPTAVLASVLLLAACGKDTNDGGRPVPAAGVATPARDRADGARFVRKLRAGEPVVIVTMGTSLTRGDSERGTEK